MSEAVRDRLAVEEGWTRHPMGWKLSTVNGDYFLIDPGIHPIPDDLNTCAAMWDKYAGKKGWSRMCDSDGDWCAFERNGERRYVTVGHSGHDAAAELRDRWALLGEVLKERGVW